MVHIFNTIFAYTHIHFEVANYNKRGEKQFPTHNMCVLSLPFF